MPRGLRLRSLSDDDFSVMFTDATVELLLATEDTVDALYARWEPLAWEHQRRHRRRRPAGCTCRDCCSLWLG